MLDKSRASLHFGGKLKKKDEMLTPLVNIIVTTISDLLSGMNIGALVWRIASSLPGILGGVQEFIRATPADKIDAALEEFDLRTGSDKDAIDILETLPNDKEEELFDAIKTVARVMIKHALKMPGYHTNKVN